jgi:HlyD family secretion protein
MRTTRRRRLLFWGAIGVVLVAVVIVAMLPKAVAVDTAVVDRGEVLVTLDHEGKTRVHDRFTVSAPVAGRVQRIELEPGDPVTANRTVLATFLPSASPLLDSRTRAEAESRIKTAEALAEQARATRDQARVEADHSASERNRMSNLFAEGLATPQALQAAETDADARQRAVDVAEAALQATLHDIETARAALVEPGRTATRTGARADAAVILRSPIDGVVLRRLHDSEVVVPQGEPLIEVADTHGLEVIADFLSTDAVRIQPGAPVLIEQWGGPAPLTGRVQRVEPSGFMKVSALGVEEQRVWVVITFEDPRTAWQALGDGYRVEARVIVSDLRDATRAPTSSLFRRGDAWAVFVVDHGKAVQRLVRVGQRNGTYAEIQSGLNAGDRVIVHPPDSVNDGGLVKDRT